jgi:beta-lactamase class D
MRILMAAAALLAACSNPSSAKSATQSIEQAFVLLELDSGRLIVENRELAEKRHIPCSTYKIPNTLIGLETGVIPDETFALKWDGKKTHREVWNRDHDLASAMKESVVWFYQEVARRIGLDRMAAWVKKLGYGSLDIGQAVDRFWLDGPLRVSPLEQVEFLRKLHAGELPVDKRNTAIVLALIELDRGEGWLLRGKTGLGEDDGKAIGWLVGSVERDGKTWVYASLVRGKDLDQIMPVRRTMAEDRLRAHGLLPAAPKK